MTAALGALLLLVALPATGAEDARKTTRPRDPFPGPALVRLDGPDRLVELCRSLSAPERLDPPERLDLAEDDRPEGDAAAERDERRGAALRERYEVVVPARDLAFAPYESAERRLALHVPAGLALPGGVRISLGGERALAVRAEPAAVRRIIEARQRGTLALALEFHLPDDATCATGSPGAGLGLPVAALAWRWLDGEVEVAAGGVAAERPTPSVAEGARPEVRVGEPLAGPAAASRAVIARAAELEACYAAALERDPRADGVLVAEFGGARVAISADSIGDAQLARCVERVVEGLAPGRAGSAAVPIRFELSPPPPGPRSP